MNTSRDEGIAMTTSRPLRIMSKTDYHPWTERLGVLLYRSRQSQAPHSDPEIVAAVEALEERYPVLKGHVWALVNEAQNFQKEHCLAPANRRLSFHMTEPPYNSFPVCLPLDPVELHELQQGERV